MDQAQETQIRDEIVKAALPEVAFDGWSWPVIERIAGDLGHDAGTVRAAFPAKIKDVLDGFADLADREMLGALSDVNAEELRIRDRVGTALMARYVWLAPRKEALRQSVQFWLVPTRKPLAGRIVWRTADRIWEWAGDPPSPAATGRQVRDYNRYTKRGLLSGVIVSTTMAFLNDETEDLDKTRGFLDRRIENVMQLGKVINKVKKTS